MESVNKGRVRWALTETSDENLRNTLKEIIENFPDDIQLWELPQWFGTCLTARLQNNQEDLKKYFDNLMELHMTLTCKACRKKIKVKSSQNVGELMCQAKNWNPIMDGLGGLHWVCPDCGDRIGKLAREIKSILSPNDDKYIDFDALVQFKEKRR